ncbi:MAG: CPBP family intramembrane metalloprotease [Oscillospiraceae bacterium]|nr:CPBP family intramembrane metalloprotease [Oscillospiraceae bacterium]
MNKTKQTALRRLLIFLAITFALSWIPAAILNHTLGYEEWFLSGHYTAAVLLFGGGPAFANVLTRLITKEGLEDSKLHLNLKGNLRYYLIALVTPLLYGVLRGVLLTARHGDFSAAGDYSGKMLAIGILQAAPYSLVMAFNTFGEEFGWRAYMNPKMEPLLGKAGTVIIGGIVWGLWHAPLTVKGHNFGTDYPGFPWLGILLMCLFCIGTGTFFMWLTDRTDSVFPASVAHAAVNNGGMIFMQLVLRGVPESLEPTLADRCLALLPEALLSFIVFGAMMLHARKKKA